MAAEENQVAASQVLVKLSSNGPKDLAWPERRITLTRDKAIVPIGRASKVRSKGFVASKHNGWFDSPVMSRDHAELVADLDTRTVRIRDIGSLHGTFLNNEQDRIAENTERPLATGDTIKFGVPIWRGQDTFAPTTVDVGLEFTATVEATRNVFKVPDYNSDLEDSDSESELEDEPDITIHTGVFFNKQSSEHIDLTKDDEKRIEIVQLDGPSAQRVIDLTSPLREESPEASLLDNDDDRAASEDLLSIVLSEDESLSGSDVDFDRDSSIRLTEQEDGADFSDDASNDDVGDMSDASSEQSDELPMSEEPDFSDEEPISDDDQGLFTWPDAPEDEAAAQHGSSTFPVELPTMAFQYETPLPPLNTPVPENQLLPSILPNAPVAAAMPLPSIIAPALREPSPSDAAMMKSSVKTTVEILKEKSGKHAFFQAREENKATLARQQTTNYPSPPSAPPVTFASNSISLKSSAHPAPGAPETTNLVQPGPSSQPVFKSPWLSAGNDFLNSPQEGHKLPQDQEQPDDKADAEAEAMTSAYKFHLWKQSLSQENESSSRRIGINDIVMGQELCDRPSGSAESEDTPRKRKAAAISTATEEEQAWQNEQHDETPAADAVVQTISPPASPPGPVSQLPSDAPRPTKRMRRIAERVGYAALGGATVGAMIVTSLIYTAPSFA